MILNYIVFGTIAFAALLFYAWTEGLWYWTRPEKGALDLYAAAERQPTISTSTDLDFIEGKRK